MKNTIKITRADNMTVKQRDAIISDPSTINLTGEVTSKKRRRNRVINRYENHFMEMLPTITVVLIVLTAVIVAWGNVASANNTNVPIENKEALEVNIIELEENRPANYDEFMKRGEELHQIKYEEQRKADVAERAFEFIIQFEGYHSEPYWDFKQYSCGYGMRCDKDTTGITKEKSKWFVMERINQIRIKHDLEKYDDDMEVALISFIYNIGSAPVGMKWYIDNGYTNALKNMMRKYSYAGGKHLRGLAIRRNAETNLF